MFKKIEEKILKNILLEITDKYDKLLRQYSSINNELKSIKYYDDVTNTLSKEGIKERLESFIKKAKDKDQKIAVIVIDIDNFKYINDVYGHGVGDIYLSRIASIIKEALPPNGIIGRLAGDSFVVAIYDGSFRDYLIFVEDLLEKISKFYLRFGGSIVKTTVSIGVAIYPQDGLTANSLIALAEQAMYASKSRGKNTYTLFNKGINQEFINIEKIRSMLNKVITKRSVYPYVQPIYDIKNREIIGGEILLRIEYNGEILPAGKFIGVAEQFGYIDKLEEIAFNRIKNSDSIKDFKEKYLFFNKTITSEEKAKILKNFINEIKSLSITYGIKPVVEITESSFVEYFHVLTNFIEYARKEGVMIALDDFGAGYASFSYLMNLDIDILKIDGSLIKNIIENKKSASIVKAISQIAKDFNIKTIAEYIESKEILERIKSFGIDYAQGYYISKPVELEKFSEIKI